MSRTSKEQIAGAYIAEYGSDIPDTTTFEEVKTICQKYGLNLPHFHLLNKTYRIDRGISNYALFHDNVLSGGREIPVLVPPSIATTPEHVPTPQATPTPVQVEAPMQTVIEEMVSKDNFVPKLSKTFTPFGYYRDMKEIIKSKNFFPVFVAGLSGNGKTFTTKQICAQLERECIVVPITIETTEDDLLGGFRLINGNTVWQDGPVIEAMKRGAVLVLDEIDLASHKIMALQSIIDGEGVLLKKINKFVSHEEGFTIVATANTKGEGKWKGQFVGTNVLNEAFLERFAVTFEQDYPTPSVESKILEKNLDGPQNEVFVKTLTQWASQIRQSYNDGAVEQVISTRRLIHIIKHYAIFRDELKAVKAGVARFRDTNKDAFSDLFVGLHEQPEVVEHLEPTPSGFADQAEALKSVGINPSI